MLVHLVNGFFRLCSVVALLVACSSFAQSVPQAIPGSEVEEMLIGTAWSGTAFGEPFDIYFLDNHAMVYRTKNGISTNVRWFFPVNAISINVIEDRQLKQKFEGTVRGNQIVGKATEIKKITGIKIEDAAESPWILNKLDKPVPELLATAPPGRPAPPPPAVIPGDFAGTYSNTFPAVVGRNDGATEFRVRCDSGGICSLKAGAGPTDVYDYLKTVRRSQKKYIWGQTRYTNMWGQVVQSRRIVIARPDPILFHGRIISTTKREPLCITSDVFAQHSFLSSYWPAA